MKVCGLTREEDVAVAAEAGADLAGFILVPESPRAAKDVLPVPDELLAVAVWVGEAGPSGAPLDQVHERSEGAVRGRDAVLLRDGEEVARLLDLPWQQEDPDHWDRAPLRRAGSSSPASSRPTTSPMRSAASAPGRSTRAPAWRPSRESRIPRRCGPTSRRRVASTYGTYGGRYVPETLIPALDELTAAWEDALADESYAAELDELARNYAGRPTPLTRAERFAPEKRLYLKREDLLHTGAHKLNNALGQAVLARRLGKERIVAETGAGQHGVATATVCARFGLECVVYMGSEDMRRQAPNVERMGLLGAEVRPVEFGTKTLKEATSEAIRDWITNVETTHYLIGSCVGPAPYPAIVRELQAVIGRETRAQVLEAEGRLPDAVIACVGGGSNAIGMFAGFLDDAEVELVGVEAAGAASLGTGRAGVLHGSRSSVLADEDGQIADAHSISAGLDYPGVGPEHAYLRDSGRARYVGTTDDEALEAFRRLTRTEGIIPALEPAHALARVDDLDGELIVVCLSGRGDKDLAEVSRRTHGTRRDARPSSIYLMSGPETPELADAAVEGGADLVELGFPFSDPLADGPVVRRAAEKALAQGMRTKACLECLAAVRERVDVPLVPMTYSSLLEAYGWERFAADAEAAGATSLIIADLPVEEKPELRRVQLVAPTSTDERLRLAADRTDGWLYLVTVTGTTGARDGLSDALAGLAERARAAAGDIPLYAGFGISTPDDARAAAELTDGVVVGSRALEAAEGGAERAARLRSLAAKRARLSLSVPSRRAAQRGNRGPASARSGEARHALSRIRHSSTFVNSAQDNVAQGCAAPNTS